ncbi:hypothetical protein Mapa_007959 [Marchantia paleacea]|nr:hypothetical protein Mapa_007959 [Marchantia paleacea]
MPVLELQLNTFAIQEIGRRRRIERRETSSAWLPGLSKFCGSVINKENHTLCMRRGFE